MAETGIHCHLCDIFFHKEKEYVTHCEGKKHRAKEQLIHDHDRANRRLFVRGIDWMRDPQINLHSYFSSFGRLNGISFGGRQGSTFAIVEFQDQEAISRALHVKHRIQRHVLYVKPYKYQPQHWERNKQANEELQEDERVKHAQTRDQVSAVLLAADTLMDQINLVAENLKLDPAERRARADICDELTELFLPHFENCRVYQFGSSVNGFGAKGCDLDLFLDIDDKTSSDKSKIKKLSQILSKSPGYAKVMTIPSNRCPVVRFLHKSSKIKCDLSINNRKALHNSYLLRLYSTDHRVHKLVSIVRLWARSQGLTSAMGGAHLFTSYAITLIVLYFLMHRKPQLIPLVCDLEKCVEGTCKEVGENSESLCIPCDAKLPPSDNKDTEVDLVKEFFAFCSESINWDTDALLMKNATVFPRSQISQDPSFIGCKAGYMTVMDPFVLTHNVVTNVNESTKLKFTTELKRAAELTRDWPASVHKLESKPWGIAELLVPSPDQTTGKRRKKSGLQSAETSNTGKGKDQDAAGNVNLVPQKNVPRVEGEQESGEFYITVQPVSQSLTCAQLLLTAKQNNVTPGEQWCNMAQELILNVLKTVFMVEMEEISLSEEDGKKKLGPEGDLIRGFDVKPQNDSEMKDQRDDKDVVKDDYVLVDACDADDDGGSQHGQMKDEVGGCKRTSGAADLDGIGVVTCSTTSTADVPLDGQVGNPTKKFCEGITKNVNEFEEVIVINALTDSSVFPIDGDHSSNACTDGKSSDDDCCMQVVHQHKIELEKQDAGSVARSNRDQKTGGSSVSFISQASADASTKVSPLALQTPSTSSGVGEVGSSKVFSYACTCKHQVWVDRKKTYAQVPQKHSLTALALEQEVTKILLARKDVFLQKVSGADQGELESLKADSEHGRSSPRQRHRGKALKKSLVKDEDLKEEKNGPQILPDKQNGESVSGSEKLPEKSKKVWPPEVEFSCQIVYQNYDVDLKLPHILIKLKPTLSSSKKFRNFFSAFRSQIQRLITGHFSEMSS